MLLFCLLTVLMMEPVIQITLDMDGEAGMDVRLTRVVLAKDGSILGLSRHQIWHWDSDGNFIRRFGGKGEGPGEFIYVSEALWDGMHYWVIDASRRVSSIFNADGKYLFHQALYFRQLLRVKDELFSLDHSKLRFDPITYPAVVQPITYEIRNRQIEIVKIGAPFKKVSKRQMDFLFNFKLVWLAIEGDRYLAVDQLEPKIHIFTKETIKRETAIPDTNVFAPDFIPIQVTRWVKPPRSFPKKQSYQASRIWLHSFSKINYFGALGESSEYVVAYLIPDPDDAMTSLQMIQAVNQEGRIMGPVFEGNGSIVGSRNRQVLVYSEIESAEDTSHVLGIYQF